MKKRLLIVAPVALAIALSTGVSPASASAGNNANCMGLEASSLNVIGSRLGTPALGGDLISSFARAGVAGERATDRTFCD